MKTVSTNVPVKNKMAAGAILLLLLVFCTNISSYATAWTTSTAGDVTNLANWTDGTTSPVSFTTPGDTWTINMHMTIAASGAESWTLGSPSPATPVTLTIASGGVLDNTGAITTATIIIYGDLDITDGKLDASGSINTNYLTVNGNVNISSTGLYTMTGSQCKQYTTVNGDLGISGSGIFRNASSIGYKYTNVNGALTMTSGTIDFTGSSSTNTFTVTGADITLSGGALSSSATTSIITNSGNFNLNGTSAITLTGGSMTSTVNGNFSMGGTSTWMCTSGIITNTLNVNGNFLMNGTNTMGVTAGISHHAITVNGNLSISGASAMTNTASSSNTIHLSLPAASGTMLIDNTSTGTWSKTNIYVDAACAAQLDGNFSNSTGGPSSSSTGSFGLTVNGVLICPAAYDVYGVGIFTLNSGATLKVAHGTGINGAIISTGTRTFSTGANYVFNGSVAQVTGSYLPTALIFPDTITVDNSAGVTLSQTTATSGTLLFTAGILHTSSYTMSAPGTPGAVFGAGANSYVDGTLIKTIAGFSSVNYEVGDLDYAPMNLIFSTAGTGGSLGVKANNGLHPSVGTSGFLATSIVNHYWTVTNYSASGPGTVRSMSTYNFSDIIGGSNATFKTQEYRSSAWLASPIATTNTVTPYTSLPGPGIPLATADGDYIYGSDCTTPAITGTMSLCAGGTTPLSDAGSGGAWSSSNTSVATVDASGVVYGVAAGSATISYTTSCAATAVVTVGTFPISGAPSVCTGATIPMSDATPGGTWSSSNTSVATVSSTGVVYGVTTGTVNIIYTFGSCTPASISVTVGAPSPVTGGTTVCIGSSINLSDATAGGSWSSSSTSVATVNSSGTVYGVAAGNAVITYDNGGCIATATITVSGTLSPISGNTAVCAGSTISLSDATSGGAWSSSNTSVGTISGTGVVSGVSAGTTNISYTVGGCAAGLAVTVNTITAILGPASVCAGSTIDLSDATPGGTWSSSLTSVLTVSSAGVATGVVPGSASVIYTVGACSTSLLITVGSPIAAITGTATFCITGSTTLSDATAGGAWSSANTSVATVTSSGVVHGATAGTTDISYTSGACSVSLPVTIDPDNGGTVSGPNTVCVGQTITLSDNVTGGNWSSSITSRATVDPATGVVNGVAPGPVTIKYAVTNTCGSYTVTYAFSVVTGSACTSGISASGTAPAVLNVFPNPNEGTFTVNMESDIDEAAHVVITNMVGQQVKEFTTRTNTSNEVDLSRASGIYLVSVATAHGNYVHKVVVY